MTNETAAVLKALRNNTESSSVIKADGSVWKDVYLDNAKGGMNPRVFAGYLSALEAEGLYERQDSVFGLVKM